MRLAVQHHAYGRRVRKQRGVVPDRQTLAHTSPHPIAALAAANDVPHTTAQRWVRESRQRGLLPPGRPGKSG